jgi:hypothetical protein
MTPEQKKLCNEIISNSIDKQKQIDLLLRFSMNIIDESYEKMSQVKVAR